MIGYVALFWYFFSLARPTTPLNPTMIIVFVPSISVVKPSLFSFLVFCAPQSLAWRAGKPKTSAWPSRDGPPVTLRNVFSAYIERAPLPPPRTFRVRVHLFPGRIFINRQTRSFLTSPKSADRMYMYSLWKRIAVKTTNYKHVSTRQPCVSCSVYVPPTKVVSAAQQTTSFTNYVIIKHNRGETKRFSSWWLSDVEEPTAISENIHDPRLFRPSATARWKRRRNSNKTVGVSRVLFVVPRCRPTS